MKITPVFFLVAMVLSSFASDAKALDENSAKELNRVSPIERHPGLTQKHPGAVYHRSSAKRKAELLAQQKQESITDAAAETELAKTPDGSPSEDELGRARLGDPSEK